MDAAHLVMGATSVAVSGTSLASVPRRHPPDIREFNTLGQFAAITQEVITVTHMTPINAESTSTPLKELATNFMVLPITVVLDHAKRSRNTFSWPRWQGCLSPSPFYLPIHPISISPFRWEVRLIRVRFFSS